jgi:hypothetical protein
MLGAMIALRESQIDPAVPTDEIEDVDIEESGFQATYASLSVAPAPVVEVVPFASVDDAVKDFVAKLLVKDSALGGALIARITKELPPEVLGILRSWGLGV